MKRTVDAHPSVVVVHSQSGEVLLSGYDGAFPKRAFIYRSTPNILGGNPNYADNSPLETILREINEEFSHEITNETWANQKDIFSIRESILENLKPFLDFYFDVGQIEGGDLPYKAIFSAFSSEISQNVMETARKNIIQGKKLVSEGWVGIHYPQQLAIAGERSTARGTAPIVGDFFKINIPYPNEIKVEKLSVPKQSYGNYESDFVYTADSSGKPNFRKY